MKNLIKIFLFSFFLVVINTNISLSDIAKSACNNFKEEVQKNYNPEDPILLDSSVFTSYGFDVYTSEVDDKGIDFVIRNQKSKYYEIQVKSLRGSGYIYMQKSKFELSNSLFASIVIFNNGKKPNVYLKWIESPI